jgi:hypothetical protein
MDNASSEYIFVSEFFVTQRGKKTSESSPSTVFHDIFDPSIKLVQVSFELIMYVFQIVFYNG